MKQRHENDFHFIGSNKETIERFISEKEELEKKKLEGETIVPARAGRPGRSGHPEMPIDEMLKKYDRLLEPLMLEDAEEAELMNKRYDKLKSEAEKAIKNLEEFRRNLNEKRTQ